MGNLKTLRTFLAGPGGDLAKRIEETLARVGLAGRARTRTAELSGGQQQRVAVARLLMQGPDLILADEPFAAVDPVTTKRVMDALFELNKEGATLLVNLHDVGIARHFPRIIALREGRPIFDGSPELLTEEKLSRIYAGDPYGTGPDPEPQDNVRYRIEDSVRLMEDRDGVSAH